MISTRVAGPSCSPPLATNAIRRPRRRRQRAPAGVETDAAGEAAPATAAGLTLARASGGSVRLQAYGLHPAQGPPTASASAPASALAQGEAATISTSGRQLAAEPGASNGRAAAPGRTPSPPILTGSCEPGGCRSAAPRRGSAGRGVDPSATAPACARRRAPAEPSWALRITGGSPCTRRGRREAAPVPARSRSASSARPAPRPRCSRESRSRAGWRGRGAAASAISRDGH